jgi:hypothetical protein
VEPVVLLPPQETVYGTSHPIPKSVKKQWQAEKQWAVS